MVVAAVTFPDEFLQVYYNPTPAQVLAGRRYTEFRFRVFLACWLESFDRG